MCIKCIEAFLIRTFSSYGLHTAMVGASDAEINLWHTTHRNSIPLSGNSYAFVV